MRRQGAAPEAATVVSVAGELLITAGVLVLLFLGWQLVWTDVTAGAASAASTAAVQARFDAAGGRDVPDDGVDDGAGVDAVHGGAGGAATTTGPVPVQDEPPVGTAFAVVHVPRFGAGWSVVLREGTGRGDVLDQGVLGHYRGTAMPGGLGNLAMAGHRTTYGAPLSRIDELAEGDPVVVETLQGWFVYRVSGHEVVTPDHVEVIAPVPGSPGARASAGVLTLTACHPRYSARLRYVVHADLVSSTLRAQGPPAVLAADPGALAAPVGG